MQGSNLELESDRCTCGRKLSSAVVYMYRSHSDRYLFHRCECGTEWTEHLTDIDPTEAVSSDEVIEVHTRLANFDSTISDLIYPHSV